MVRSTPKNTQSTVQAVKSSSETVLAWILSIGSVVGLIASFVLTYDKLQLVQNPDFVPNCNLNPVLSCGSVMASQQGDVFGFPNPWIGLIGFGALLAIGTGMLAGATYRRWFWLGVYAGQTLGLLFALWLLYESVYVIGALCPYCLATDVAVITMFWYTSLYLVERGLVRLPRRARTTSLFARQHHLDILIAVFLVLVIVILQHFWYYYGQYF